MTSSNQPITVKGVIKIITILHYAYCIAILIFGTVAIFITENGTINFSNTGDIFFYIVPLFAVAMAYLSHFVFQINLKKVHQKLNLKEKLVQYQMSRIIRYAMLEAPALLGIVVFIITNNQFYLIISAALLAYLFLLKPTKRVIEEELDLNSAEKREFKSATEN
jgi:hypothetical protein